MLYQPFSWPFLLFVHDFKLCEYKLHYCRLFTRYFCTYIKSKQIQNALLNSYYPVHADFNKLSIITNNQGSTIAMTCIKEERCQTLTRKTVFRTSHVIGTSSFQVIYSQDNFIAEDLTTIYTRLNETTCSRQNNTIASRTFSKVKK